MKRLNYNHLFYFWTVARTGSVSAASTELHVSQPTVSEQLGILEKELGRKLFRRAGRKLELTRSGELVRRHTEKMFRVANELSKALGRTKRPSPRRKRKA